MSIPAGFSWELQGTAPLSSDCQGEKVQDVKCSSQIGFVCRENTAQGVPNITWQLLQDKIIQGGNFLGQKRNPTANYPGDPNIDVPRVPVPTKKLLPGYFGGILEELKPNSWTLRGRRWEEFGCIRRNSSLSSQGVFSALLRVSSYFNLDFNSINRIGVGYGPVPIPKLRGSVQRARGSIPSNPKSFSCTSFLGKMSFLVKLSVFRNVPSNRALESTFSSILEAFPSGN